MGSVSKMDQSFRDAGYSASYQQQGAQVCSESSSENNMSQLSNVGQDVNVELKRQRLIEFAVGFARVYNTHRYEKTGGRGSNQE